MIVKINNTDVPVLEDVDNFRAFKASAVCDENELASALKGLGRLDTDGNAWISRAWLLAQGRPNDPKWADGFEAMHKYASEHGWVDSETDSIRAHVEYAPPSK